MRILIACGSPKRSEGGVAAVVLNLATELRALGHTVDALFLEDLLPKNRFPKRFEAIEIALAVARRVGRNSSAHDVVNIHAPYGFAYGIRRRWWGLSSCPPYVMTMHGLEERRIHAMRREAAKGRAWYFGARNRLWNRVYHMPAYRYSIITADESVVLNREAWSCLQLKYRCDANRVSYIPNGVEKQFFLRREYSAASPRKLLFVGSWLDHKGVYYLREGFVTLAKEFPGLELTIAGCGVEAEVVRRFFPSELQEKLHVFPFLSKGEMPSVYASHDLFVFPSLVEGMPLVLLEAMAAGLPVVTTDTCGMADLVEDGIDGLLVKPADSEGFAGAVRRVISSQELRMRMGRAAQEKMRRFTWDRIARSFERVLQRAVGVATGPEDGGPDTGASEGNSSREMVGRGALQ